MRLRQTEDQQEVRTGPRQAVFSGTQLDRLCKSFENIGNPSAERGHQKRLSKCHLSAPPFGCGPAGEVLAELGQTTICRVFHPDTFKTGGFELVSPTEVPGLEAGGS